MYLLQMITFLKPRPVSVDCHRDTLRVWPSAEEHYLDDLCVHRTMTLRDWIEIGATLGVEGLEFYSGFLQDNEAFLKETKAIAWKWRVNPLRFVF